MTIVTSLSEMQRTTATRTATLMRLEVPFARDLRSYFRQISKDFKTVYSATGSPINVSRFNDELQAILKKHYRKVAKAFRSDLTGQVDKKFDVVMHTKQEEADQIVDLAIAEYIDGNSVQEASIINETTQNDLNAETAGVITAAALDGVSLSNTEIANEAALDFNSKIPGRSSTISMTEAGNMQSATDFIEKEVLILAGVTVGGVAFNQQNYERIWDTILDSKTRQAHVAADSQRVGLNQNFQVGGESLRFPRDYRQGSAANTINCRCQAYEVRTDTTF